MFDTYKEVLVPFCQENDYKIRSYSGRGMYGKNCIGIVIPSNTEMTFIYALTKTIYTSGLDPETDLKTAEEFLEEFISDLTTDTMGRDDIVVYNPSFKWEEFNNEESNEGEDDE